MKEVLVERPTRSSAAALAFSSLSIHCTAGGGQAARRDFQQSSFSSTHFTRGCGCSLRHAAKPASAEARLHHSVHFTEQELVPLRLSGFQLGLRRRQLLLQLRLLPGSLDVALFQQPLQRGRVGPDCWLETLLQMEGVPEQQSITRKGHLAPRSQLRISQTCAFCSSASSWAFVRRTSDRDDSRQSAWPLSASTRAARAARSACSCSSALLAPASWPSFSAAIQRGGQRSRPMLTRLRPAQRHQRHQSTARPWLPMCQPLPLPPTHHCRWPAAGPGWPAARHAAPRAGPAAGGHTLHSCMLHRAEVWKLRLPWSKRTAGSTHGPSAAGCLTPSSHLLLHQVRMAGLEHSIVLLAVGQPGLEQERLLHMATAGQHQQGSWGEPATSGLLGVPRSWFYTHSHK